VGEPLKRSVSHLHMKPQLINKPMRFVVRWSPLIFILNVVWAVLEWRHQSGFFSHLVAYVALGVICGVLIVLGYRYNSLGSVLVLCYMVFISAQTILNGLVFSIPELQVFPMRPSSQYASALLASYFGLMVILRKRIQRFVAERDAEQALGAESP
jgi:hypothetical protein